MTGARGEASPLRGRRRTPQGGAGGRLPEKASPGWVWVSRQPGEAERQTGEGGAGAETSGEEKEERRDQGVENLTPLIRNPRDTKEPRKC